METSARRTGGVAAPAPATGSRMRLGARLASPRVLASVPALVARLGALVVGVRLGLDLRSSDRKLPGVFGVCLPLPTGKCGCGTGAAAGLPGVEASAVASVAGAGHSELVAPPEVGMLSRSSKSNMLPSGGLQSPHSGGYPPLAASKSRSGAVASSSVLEKEPSERMSSRSENSNMS